MDYEKAFDRAKSAYGTGAYDDATLEFIFPELRESEDGRIRKFLVDYFASYKIGNVTTKLNGVRIDDILNYLEKQKINTEGDFGRGYDCGYEACLNSHGAEWFEKQKEQKPVEWSEEDEKMRNALWNLLKIQYAQDYSMTGVGIEAGKFRDWLKSLRGPKSSDNWRPSEEQMKALQNAVALAAGNKVLAGLYEQLKSL